MKNATKVVLLNKTSKYFSQKLGHTKCAQKTNNHQF